MDEQKPTVVKVKMIEAKPKPPQVVAVNVEETKQENKVITVKVKPI